MSVDEHKFLKGIESLLKTKIDQITEEGFKPTDKPSNEPRSRNFKWKKSGFKKRQAMKKGRTDSKKLNSSSGNKPTKNKKKGSKAKTRWKKGKTS